MGAIRMAPLLPRLEDRLSLLINGRRTALPRQQTMRATLDWSYGLLTDTQQMILRRLSIFPGEFTPRAADAVISDDTYSSSEIIDQVTELIAKSLVVAEMGDPEPRLRLLETTRVYAREKLTESGEHNAVAGAMQNISEVSFKRDDARLPKRATASARPISVMNSRRFIRSRGVRRVVHHTKIDRSCLSELLAGSTGRRNTLS